MPIWPKVASFWRMVVRGRRLDDELDEELRGFVDEIAARKIAAGVDPVRARRQAAMDVGCAGGLQGECEQQRRGERHSAA